MTSRTSAVRSRRTRRSSSRSPAIRAVAGRCGSPASRCVWGSSGSSRRCASCRPRTRPPPRCSPPAAAIRSGSCPARVDANVAVDVGVPATMPLISLPSADLLVGDVTARVAYAASSSTTIAITTARSTSRVRTASRPRAGRWQRQRQRSADRSARRRLRRELRLDDRSPISASRIARARSARSPRSIRARAAAIRRSGSRCSARAGSPRRPAIDATIAGTLPQEDPATLRRERAVGDDDPDPAASADADERAGARLRGAHDRFERALPRARPDEPAGLQRTG